MSEYIAYDPDNGSLATVRPNKYLLTVITEW